MSSVVADTHTILWYLADDPDLSQRAGDTLDGACAAGDGILVPTICIVEAVYLVEKRRISPEGLERLIGMLLDEDTPVHPVALTIRIAEELRNIPRKAVPDLPDRVIALGLPLVTRDDKIRAFGIETIW